MASATPADSLSHVEAPNPLKIWAFGTGQNYSRWPKVANAVIEAEIYIYKL